MSKISKTGHKPHDSIFTRAMSDLRVARDFFAQHLPQPLLSALDLSTLTTCKDKFVDDRLRAKVTDMLYQIAFNTGQQAYLSLHVEHQSQPEQDMPLRILEYQVLIMRHEWEKRRHIPLIYSMVFYNGKKPWHFPLTLAEQMDAPSELITQYAFSPLKPIPLIDLNHIDDATLRQHLWSGVLAVIMKHIYERDILSTVETIIAALREIETLNGRDFVNGMLYYIYTEGEISDKDKLTSLIRNNLSQETRGEFMTIIDQMVQERLQEERMNIDQMVQERVQEERVTIIDQMVQERLQEETMKMEERVQQEKFLLAKNMLLKGLDIVLISEITGIDINVLKQMKDGNRKN